LAKSRSQKRKNPYVPQRIIVETQGRTRHAGEEIPAARRLPIAERDVGEKDRRCGSTDGETIEPTAQTNPRSPLRQPAPLQSRHHCEQGQGNETGAALADGADSAGSFGRLARW